MEASVFAKELQLIIEQLKADGTNEIKSENLIRYLSDAVKDLDSDDSINIELYKANLQKWVEEHKSAHTHSVEMFRSVITAGQNALRTSFLMNGGSSVAMLAFIGHLTTKTPEKVHLFSTSLAIFVIGVLLSAVASGATYLGQWFYAGNKTWKGKTGFILNIVAILLAISSYFVFAYGIKEAFDVFSNFT
jgi:hypothetical protein